MEIKKMHRAHIGGNLSSSAGLKDTKKGTIAVIGLGYVGLPLAIAAEKEGYTVIGFDINTSLLDTLRIKEAPDFLEENDRAYIKKHRMILSDNPSVLSDANAVIICVPTPVYDTHLPDLEPLIGASEALAPNLARGTVVIAESTVNPGVCEEVVLPILERGSGLRVEEDFYFAHCPERINPGDETWNVNTIPRVLGASGPKSLEKALEIYRDVLDVSILPMATIKEAEAVKMVENSFRDINIAFVNELAMSFDKLGIDVVNVIKGASTKPFGFMPHFPGCGVGGHCIPVDPYYLIAYAKQNGFTHKFLETAREINNHMPIYTVDLLEKALTEAGLPLMGSKIALLGLSYKRDIPDIRESPAIEIAKDLSERGARVMSYDPHIPKRSMAISLDEALAGARAVILATDHKQFRELTPQDLLKHNIRIIIDGRNCLDMDTFRAADIDYHGIGR